MINCPSNKVMALVALVLVCILSPFLYFLVKYLYQESVMPDCGEREYLTEVNTKMEIGFSDGNFVCKKCPDYTRGTFDRKTCRPDVCGES